ncbi:CapA family protein [Halegenticoccus tardaugens]|uniref:CapA family protein n=1 Tax=Halegenticoccus tardaugens TaxID=2071624 RepID=UPI00100AF701|nr:CapA family protein [Halegenticoccus tardaugens]
MARSTRIGLAGDVMLGRQVDARQRSRPLDAVWGDVLPRLRSLDGLLINLECCLSERGRPWTRTYRPFHFRATPDRALPALRSAGVDCCSLANNHTLDYGEPALLDTLDALDGAGIARSGAGRTVAEAREPARFSVDGLDVAVVSFTDNTPEYAATPDSPGTAHVRFDPASSGSRRVVDDALSAARARDPDLLVASLHWGPNMVTEPPPAFRTFGRRLVDRGVDVVHGHSAHVFQGVEVRDGKPILYDAGDFVDDYVVDPDLRNDLSFLFEVAVDGDGAPTDLRLSPVEIRDCAVHEATPAAARWCRDRMRELSAPFGTSFEREEGGLRIVLDD